MGTINTKTKKNEITYIDTFFNSFFQLRTAARNR